MNIWHDIDEKRINPNEFVAVIEIAKGTKKKYELDKETGMIILDRLLHTSTHYPANYGFIPKTLAKDGDPLDVLVLCSESLDPLVLVKCYPIAVVQMTDCGKEDEKIIAIPFGDPVYNGYERVEELPKFIMEELVHFLRVYKDLEEGKVTQVGEIRSNEEANKVIMECKERYNQKFGKKSN